MGFSKPEGLMGRLLVKSMNRFHAGLASWGTEQFGVVSPDAHILDVGCGGGANVAQWLKKCMDGKVYGLDYSDVCVAEAKRINHDAILSGRCQIFHGSVSEIPVQDCTLDVVSAYETVYFWPDITKDFAEVCRVLKPGGRFLIVNEISGENESEKKWEGMVKGLKLLKPAQYNQVLQNAGFSHVETFRHPKRRKGQAEFVA